MLEFAANEISYDIPNAQILAANLETLDSVTNTNNTNVQQSTTVSGEKSVAETYGWKHAQGVKVTASAKVGIPFIGSTQITVEGSLNFEQNGSTTTSRKFAWQQPVLVPAKSKVGSVPTPRSVTPPVESASSSVNENDPSKQSVCPEATSTSAVWTAP